MSLLEVRNLTVDIPTEDGVIHAVQNVSFSVDPGQFFGVVGESGSGKSVMVQALLGLVPGAKITGEAIFDGHDLLTMSGEGLRSLRGASISMIFQDPLSSLHPQYTIGWQISEQLRTHEKMSRAVARTRSIELLKKVGISDATDRYDAYPHQFSGGMRQRVMIAMALSLNPRMIIADEPTTALDSTVQAQILDLLHDMRQEFDTTVIMITHDLTVLSRVADTMMVMYAGKVLEFGPADAVFDTPQHPYTAGLLRSSPNTAGDGARLIPIGGRPPSLLDVAIGCIFAPRCPDVLPVCVSTQPPSRVYDNGILAACWLETSPSEPSPAQVVASPAASSLSSGVHASHGRLFETIALEKSFHDRRTKTNTLVLRGIDLSMRRGETLGLVGESGCGKSTLARVIAGLIPATAGSVHFDGQPLEDMSRAEWHAMRRRVQLIFQDPYGSLNPKRRVGAIIGDPLRLHKMASGLTLKTRVRELMELVGLNPEHYNRFPAQFSGGQRQRIGIARALALNPDLIICDEPVSALDVSIQAQVLNLMEDLQTEFDLSYLFISHDLSVVRHVCDRIAVMDGGHIIELADTERLYSHPQEDFTKLLLAASSPAKRRAPTGRGTLIRTIDASASERGIA